MRALSLPCSRFSVSQNFCSSEKYLSSMKTLDMPTTEGFMLVLLVPDMGQLVTRTNLSTFFHSFSRFHEKSLLPSLWFFLFFNFRWTSLAVNLSCWELSKARALVVISRICWEEGPSLDKNGSRDPKVHGEQWSVGATGKMSLMGFSRQL